MAQIPEFEFVVEGITQEQAEKLLDVIIAAVEEMGGSVGGGFYMKEDKDEQDPEAV